MDKEALFGVYMGDVFDSVLSDMCLFCLAECVKPFWQ